MIKQKNPYALHIQRKENKKRIRTILQILLLFIAFILLIKELFFSPKYEPINQSLYTEEDGFIALTYKGIERSNSSKYISKKKLAAHLSALHEQGYVTISQQDIIDYYEHGKKLPEKALFLAFEDGRTNSSIFGQRILEKLNYQATIFTYATKIVDRDKRFLQSYDLKNLLDTGYWEIGAHGNRLTYINSFDTDGNYLGIIDEDDLSDQTAIEYYNHFLMDFLRDEYMIPIEHRHEMEQRIRHEYSSTKETYESTLGFMPKAFAIMHANTLYHDMNPLVEAINDQEIRHTFPLHFNLEGNAFNGPKADLYNLTRLQVSPFWSTNHLLMQIQKDAKHSVEFVVGNKAKAAHWKITNGAAQFTDNELILTSPPSEEGFIVLNERIPSNFSLHVTLKGNIVGEQTIYLRYNEEQQSYVKLSLKNNIIFIYEKLENEDEQEIASFPLNQIKWDGEDYAFQKATVYSYMDTKKGSRINEDEYPRSIPGNRQVDITLENHHLHFVVDKGIVDEQIEIHDTHKSGNIALGSTYVKKETSYEQFDDDIYDAIFKDLVIESQDDIIYTHAFNGWKKMIHHIEQTFDELVDYFIEHF